MSDDDIERFEEERELELYREYRDVVPMFQFAVETERRFYLANQVEIRRHPDGWVEVEMADAWVWDMYRPARFVSSVRVVTLAAARMASCAPATTAAGDEGKEFVLTAIP